jgi:hypothetical protein
MTTHVWQHVLQTVHITTDPYVFLRVLMLLTRPQKHVCHLVHRLLLIESIKVLQAINVSVRVGQRITIMELNVPHNAQLAVHQTLVEYVQHVQLVNIQ